jgi:hypothetical protein
VKSKLGLPQSRLSPNLSPWFKRGSLYFHHLKGSQLIFWFILEWKGLESVVKLFKILETFYTWVLKVFHIRLKKVRNLNHIIPHCMNTAHFPSKFPILYYNYLRDSYNCQFERFQELLDSYHRFFGQYHRI